MFILLNISVLHTLIYILAAVLPAVFLMRYIYSKDQADKEPPALLRKLVLLGMASAGVALVIELLWDNFLIPNIAFANTTQYAIVSALLVGITEEGCKLFFLYKSTWNNPNFNYRYDGVVYAVFVSLGFALLENIMYVFSYGLSVALSRALLAVPAHMGFAVFMGSFYGRAKIQEVRYSNGGKTINLILGYVTAVFLHTFYDAAAMIGSDVSAVVYILFVVIMYVVVYLRIRKEANEDRPIY